ncbi:MAG: HTH domain-containing protein [Lachnospiraceae bacterium]|nr:HTH domain-containing protein [Lachnospiraceae bacterium]
MGNATGDLRMIQILKILRKNRTVTVTELAEQLEVSDRTIRNDMKQLNQELKNCGVIEGKLGKYSLKVFDENLFRQMVSSFDNEDRLLSSPRGRMDYVFGKLIRAEEPVLTDELAYEMNVSRTTLIGDLKKLRSELALYQIELIGKTSKGMVIEGNEEDIRRYILDVNNSQLYSDYPLDSEIRKIVDAFYKEMNWEHNLIRSYEKYLILMLDRFLNGHEIKALPHSFYNLTATKTFPAVNRLIDQIGKFLFMDFPVEEKLFTMIPIAGMRTPTDLAHLERIQLDPAMDTLLERILEQIQRELQISIDGGDYARDFKYHLMFMINRLRFQIKLDNPVSEDVIGKYPLAFRMAKIAFRMICQEYEVSENDAELGYLTAYFAVFLEKNNLLQEEPLRIAVICGTGRVTSHLISMQLRKELDSSAQIDIFPLEAVSAELLASYHAVLTTVDLPFETDASVIRVTEIFDAGELVRKIEKIRYLKLTGSDETAHRGSSLLARMLEESCFYVLESDMTYQEALDFMIEPLMDEGVLDEGFAERLSDREKQGTMVFGNSVAIPHMIQTVSDEIVLAMGCSEAPIKYNETDVSVIILLGLPQQSEETQTRLIQVYEEIIEITKNKELLQKIAGCESYQKLLRVLYR